MGSMRTQATSSKNLNKTRYVTRMDSTTNTNDRNSLFRGESRHKSGQYRFLPYPYLLIIQHGVISFINIFDTVHRFLKSKETDHVLLNNNHICVNAPLSEMFSQYLSKIPSSSLSISYLYFFSFFIPIPYLSLST